MKLDRFGPQKAVIAAMLVFCTMLVSARTTHAEGIPFRKGAPVKISFSTEPRLENAWSLENAWRVDPFDVSAPRSTSSNLNFVVTPFSDRIHAKIDLGRTVRKSVFSLTVSAEGEVEGIFDRQTGAITLPPIPLKWSERFFNMAWVMLSPSKFRNYEEVSPEEKKEFDELRRWMGPRAHDLPWTANLSGNLDWRGGGGMGRLEVNALFRGDWHVAASDHAYIVPPDRVFPGLGFIKTLEVFADATTAKKAFGPGKAAWAIPNLGDEAKFRHGMRNEVLVRKGCWQVTFVNQNSKFQPGRPEPGPEFIARVEILDRYVQSLLVQPGSTADNPPVVRESPPMPPADPPSGQPPDSTVPPEPTQPIAGNLPSSTSPESGGEVGVQPPASDDSATGTDMTETSPDDSPTTMISPETAAGGAAVLGGLGVIGAWLTMLSSGVGWKDVTDGAREWLSGTPPIPVEPPQVTLPPRGRDGQTNEQGDVWSDEDGGWIGRNLYEQEKARGTWLDQKAQDDLRAGQSEDVKKVYDLWQASTIDRRKAQVELIKRQVEDMSVDLDLIQHQEQREGTFSKDREEFLKTVVDKAQKTLQGLEQAKKQDNAGKDATLQETIRQLDQVSDVLRGQQKKGFQIVRGARDMVEDAVLRGGAMGLDLVWTRGAASIAVTTMMGTRDGILAGMGEGDALKQGLIQGTIEGSLIGVGEVAGKLGLNQLLWTSVGAGALAGGMSVRDQLEAGKTLFEAATRATGDALFAGGTSFAAGAAMEPVAVRAQGWRERLFPPETLQASPPRDVIGKIHDARKAIEIGPDGKKILSIEETAKIMKDSRVGRTLKQGSAEEVGDVRDAYQESTRQIKKTHDENIITRYKAEHPEHANAEVKISDFSTPGKKTNLSVDRDQCMLVTDKSGKVTEVPREKWQRLSHEEFAKTMNYNEAKFRESLSPADRKAFDAIDCNPAHRTDVAKDLAKKEFFQEKHGWKSTDRMHPEASRDNAKQVTDLATGKSAYPDKANIQLVKAGKATLVDAEGEGLMYKHKELDALHSNQPVEAYAQRRKLAETLNETVQGYRERGFDVKLKPNMKEAVRVMKQMGDAAATGDQRAVQRLEGRLQELGFKNSGDMEDKMVSQLQSLKVAQKGLLGEVIMPVVLPEKLYDAQTSTDLAESLRKAIQ